MLNDKLDIVYCLKSIENNEELRYSLRSLKNIPHNKIWIFGDCPDWVKNVNFVPVVQDKGNKWLNVSDMLERICQNDDITEDFIWFNDDFFVLKKINELPYYYDRTLAARILDFRKQFPTRYNLPYCSRLRGAERCLKIRNKTTLNYELHIPIIFNRKKLQQVCEVWGNVGAKRSLYANFFLREGIQRNDVKIYDLRSVPKENQDFLSTSDMSFKAGEVGKFIKKKFNRKCKYERD